MGELILLLGDEFHHLRQKQNGKKVGESKYWISGNTTANNPLFAQMTFPIPPPKKKKKCIPKGYNFTHTLTPKQSNKFSPQSNNIELVECNVEERKEAVKDLKQDTFYYKRVVPIFFSPVKNKRKLYQLISFCNKVQNCVPLWNRKITQDE